MPLVGIIANPVSARDIRRVVASACGLQISDRANIVLRALAGLAAAGVDQALMMPDRGGIAAAVVRGLERAHAQGEQRFPKLSFLDMKPIGTVADTHCAARRLQDVGAEAIVVLGGDGTHRAVVAGCGPVPIAGISTGTNNAFPQACEPTVTGLATGLAISGAIPDRIAFAPNKLIRVSVDGAPPDLALVDVAVVTDRFVGARALWRSETFRELFVTFADPRAIGMSAIAGLLEPIAREEPGGLMARLCPADRAPGVVHAAIGPGLVEAIGIEDWRRMPSGVPFVVSENAGAIALDGERELFFDAHQTVTVTLVENAFRTVDAAAVMRFAATGGLMRTAERCAAPSEV